MLARSLIVDSLLRLGEYLQAHPIPPAIEEAAIAQNPWFTPYYLQHSVAHISTWLQPGPLLSFAVAYPSPSKSLRVGIIAAGNLPLAGFHDVLVSLLSQHIAVLKSSHQDAVFLPWLLDTWTHLSPDLKPYVQQDASLANIDFLLASGSNNTARYLETRFKEIPKLIRKNRYSLVYLDEQVSKSSLDALCQDLLLYNGLGCRNVSNIISPPHYRLDELLDQLKIYSEQKINPYYLQKLQLERVRLQLHQRNFTDGQYILILPETSPRSSIMGVVNWVKTEQNSDIDQIISNHSDQIQCCVNKGIDFGKTQYPNLNQFADDVDTMKMLTNM